MDNTQEPIATQTIKSREQDKRFHFDLYRNNRGLVLKVKEVCRNGAKNIVMIPGEILDEAAKVMDEMARHAD